MVLRFDEPSLVLDLERLQPSFRAVFAAAVAERMLPGYLTFSHRTERGDPTALSSILEHLWRDIEGQPTSERQGEENIALAMNLMPREEEGSWAPEQAWAEDTVSAVAYSLRCKQNGRAQEAAWAARRAYEALDHFVITTEAININEPGAEEKILSNPLIQAELSRQQRDLDELQSANSRDVSQVASQMRERAKAESEIFFDGHHDCPPKG